MWANNYVTIYIQPAQEFNGVQLSKNVGFGITKNTWYHMMYCNICPSNLVAGYRQLGFAVN